MNRHALPSILLSIFFVSFFAVALYQRDPESGRSAKEGVSREPARARDIKKSARGGISAATRDAVTPEGRAVATPSQVPPSTVSSPAPTPLIPHDGKRREVATVRVRDAGDPIEGGAGRRTQPEGPSATIRIVSDRADSPSPSPAPSPPIPKATARASGAKVARAPFTIVGSGETITDVARRVYGTADDGEWLRRANRDLMREPGATLSPGTVLRTPPRSGR